MSIQLPRILKNFNVIVDGWKKAGVIKEITPPKLTKKMEEFRNGGMMAPLKADMGYEALEVTMEFSEWDDEVIGHLSNCDLDGVPVRFTGYQEADNGSCEHGIVDMLMRGRFSEIDFGSAKVGEANTLKVTMPLSLFSYSLNSVEIIYIDILGMVERIYGIDKLAARRAVIEV